MAAKDNAFSKVAAGEVTRLELKLLANGKLDGFVLLPSDICRIWKSSRVKEELVRFFQELYKPRS